ncbi:DUF2314 domain-containing protein [Cypionkella sp.]|uniref:DUF2314 domain-containing protein n=1 Tax=Cypionkella sp. TaxID=2811411 RepID=UPI002634386F|nr:DUF2314 domain-containing protein [Cypionkella sp.]
MTGITLAKLPEWHGEPESPGNHVVAVSKADIAMNTAIAQAKRSLPVFLAHVLDDAGVIVTPSTIKVAMPTTGGNSDIEHIWVMPFRRLPDGTFSGELNNAPRNLGALVFGDTISFSQDQISDWALQLSDGLIYGDYTNRVMLAPSDGIPNGPKFSSQPVPEDWEE